MAQLADLVDNISDGGSDGDTGPESDTESTASDTDSAGDAEGEPTGDGEAKDTDGPDDAGDGAGEATEDGESSDEQSGDGSGDEPGEDTGYIADEGEAEDKSEAEPTAPTPELQYIADNLPTITVRGKTANGSVRNFNIKAAGQLPEDFEFASDRDRALFTQQIAEQDAEARRLQTEYRSSQTKKQQEDFEKADNEAIRHDIGDLQRSGDIPRFKFQPGDPRFANDPAVKQAQEILEFRNKHNQDMITAGRTDFVSYATAFKLWKAEQGTTTAKTAQEQEDKARKKATRELAGGTGQSNEDVKKPRVWRSMDDLVASLDERV